MQKALKQRRKDCQLANRKSSEMLSFSDQNGSNAISKHFLGITWQILEIAKTVGISTNMFRMSESSINICKQKDL